MAGALHVVEGLLMLSKPWVLTQHGSDHQSPEQTPSCLTTSWPEGTPPSGRSHVRTQLPREPEVPTSFLRGVVHRSRSPQSSELEPLEGQTYWHPPKLSHWQGCSHICHTKMGKAGREGCFSGQQRHDVTSCFWSSPSARCQGKGTIRVPLHDAREREHLCPSAQCQETGTIRAPLHNGRGRAPSIPLCTLPGEGSICAPLHDAGEGSILRIPVHTKCCQWYWPKLFA